MAKETEDRVNVAIERELYKTFSQIAKLMELTAKDATARAISEWNRRNAPQAQKRSKEILQSAA